jgi:hypothetical protein
MHRNIKIYSVRHISASVRIHLFQTRERSSEVISLLDSCGLSSQGASVLPLRFQKACKWSTRQIRSPKFGALADLFPAVPVNAEVVNKYVVQFKKRNELDLTLFIILLQFPRKLMCPFSCYSSARDNQRRPNRTGHGVGRRHEPIVQNGVQSCPVLRRLSKLPTT